MNNSWVLVVEDDDDVRDTLLLVLDMAGFVTVGAVDGLDALDQIRKRGRPGIVLLDLRMPRMSGAEFASAVHADPELAPAPIVIVSGDNNARDVAGTLGVQGLLTKPIEMPELVATVRRFVPQTH